MDSLFCHSTCLKVLPHWSTKETGKELPCSLKRASKGQKHLKPLLLWPSCSREWGLGMHEIFFQLQLILLFLSSIREVFHPSRRENLFPQASAAGICMKPDNALWLLQAVRPGGPILPQKWRAACCSQAKRGHRIYRHHQEALFYFYFLFAAG